MVKIYLHTAEILWTLNEDILKMWMKLFGDFEDPDLKDEIFLTLVLEIFKDITEHFVRLAFVDALKYF